MVYLIACGAPLAARIAAGAQTAREYDWRPVIMPTAAARAWLEQIDLGGELVVSEETGLGHEFPAPGAVVVAPLTFNTLVSWADGRVHSAPLATLAQALATDLPIVAVPFAKHELADRPGWQRSLTGIKSAGVTIIDPQSGAIGTVVPITSGTGPEVADRFQWSWVFTRLLL